MADRPYALVDGGLASRAFGIPRLPEQPGMGWLPLAEALDIRPQELQPLPADLVAAARGKVLEGTYKLCIAPNGSVKSVVPVVSIAGADKAIIATLSTWKFPALPVAICKLQKLSFEIP